MLWIAFQKNLHPLTEIPQWHRIWNRVFIPLFLSSLSSFLLKYKKKNNLNQNADPRIKWKDLSLLWIKVCLSACAVALTKWYMSHFPMNHKEQEQWKIVMIPKSIPLLDKMLQCHKNIDVTIRDWKKINNFYAASTLIIKCCIYML